MDRNATLILVFAMLCQSIVAVEKRYKPADPKVVAKAESIAAELKAAPSKKKRKVLVYGISHGPHRAGIATSRRVFSILGEKTGAYEAVVSEDLANFEADKLKEFDAVIFANTTGEVFCRPCDKAKFKALSGAEKKKQEQNGARLAKNLDDYIRAGGGFMGIHAATDTLKKQKSYGDMVGAIFEQHPWSPKQKVTIKVDDPGHALTKGIFESNEFTFNDEIYEFRDEPYSRDKVHLLMSIDAAKSDKPVKTPRRKDGDYPVAWVKNHGKGRVFYCSLGHATTPYTAPAILQFWLRGIQFITGDIEADTTPTARGND